MKDLLAQTKALGDESRLRALAALRGGELCLCQLIEILQLSPSTVSRHMAILWQAGLLTRRKEGRWHYYKLADKPAAVRQVLRWVMQMLDDEPTLRRDEARLRIVRAMDLKELTQCYCEK